MQRLGREFYERNTVRVARDLLGKLVVRRLADGRTVSGRIVETEAYHGPADRASHAHRGPTPRNAPMFGPGGVAYVYQIYGVWFCLNAVTMRDGFPAAVLIRAIDLEGREGAGPGKLCRALSIDRRLTGSDLVASEELSIADDGFRTRKVETGPRVNVDYAAEWAAKPWRFWLPGHPAVSKR
jgi:DNA-3-methyladenine glycosylase